MENNKPYSDIDGKVNDGLEIDFDKDIDLNEGIDLEFSPLDDIKNVDNSIVPPPLDENIFQEQTNIDTKTANGILQDPVENALHNLEKEELLNKAEKISDEELAKTEVKDTDSIGKVGIGSHLDTTAHSDKNQQDSISTPVTTPRTNKKVNKNKTKKLGDSSKKTKSASKSNLFKLIIAALLLAIIAVIAFMFLGQPDSAEQKQPIVDTTHIDKTKNKPEISKPTSIDSKVRSDAKDANKDSTSKQDKVDSKEDPQQSKDSKDSKPTTDKKEPAKYSTSVNPLDIKIPDPEKIISAEIPKEDSLVKEEIDLLKDQSERLDEQEKLLTKRVEMMDELTSKKQEQIELLEKKIAQLEKSQKDSQ